MNVSTKDLKVLASILDNPIHASDLADALYDLANNETAKGIYLEGLDLEITKKE